MLDFPARFVLDFFANHGLLQVRDRPTWRSSSGGSARYVERLLAPLGRDRIRLSRAGRTASAASRMRVVVRSAGRVERFDQVVLACHADQALALLDDPSMAERAGAGRVPLPAQRRRAAHRRARCCRGGARAWAAWNYRVPADAGGAADASPTT